MARVLVIDDEPDVVRLIVKVLSGRGHVVQVARDALPLLERGLLLRLLADHAGLRAHDHL